MPSKPLRLSNCTALILDLSFHIIVSLPYINTGTSNDSYKTLAHSSCKLLIAPATLLLLPNFLLHSASSVPHSSKTYPKYLNSKTCSICILSTQPHTPTLPPYLVLTCINFQTSSSPHLNKSSHHCP